MNQTCTLQACLPKRRPDRRSERSHMWSRKGKQGANNIDGVSEPYN